MPYTKLLNDIIDRSGLTLKEIAEKCTANGVKVTASYISTLKNDTNNRAPSDEMSRAIAKACNCKDEGILVLEAYIDNAPPEFKGVLDFLKSTIMFSMIGVFENQIDNSQFQDLLKMTDSMPLSSLLIQLSKTTDESIEKAFGMFNMTSTIDDEINDIRIQTDLKEAQGFPVLDNSMFPIMPENSKAVIEYKITKDLCNGDIIAFSRKNETELIYRKVVFLDEEHTKVAVFPINTEYETLTFDCKDIIILGKVNQVVANL